jgi:predicted dithiol-disulfide oxidoreductase (DUF899 family)
MNLPQVVSPAEWEAARERLLVKEKEATRARDALAAERRRLPVVRIDNDYVLDGPHGKASLLDLFDGRRQLIVYHFMFGPSANEGCDGCSMVVDNIGHLAHLHARDTSFALVSRAPSAKIEPFKERMGWTGDSIFRTYFTNGRGVEALGSNWTFLDLTPLGRQEDWEDSPDGYPQTPRYAWWRLHDEYDLPKERS